MKDIKVGGGRGESKASAKSKKVNRTVLSQSVGSMDIKKQRRNSQKEPSESSFKNEIRDLKKTKIKKNKSPGTTKNKQ